MNRQHAHSYLMNELNNRTVNNHQKIDKFLDTKEGKEFINKPIHIKEVLKRMGF